MKGNWASGVAARGVGRRKCGAFRVASAALRPLAVRGRAGRCESHAEVDRGWASNRSMACARVWRSLHRSIRASATAGKLQGRGGEPCGLSV